MEPIYSVEIRTPSSFIEDVYAIIALRKGEIVSDDVCGSQFDSQVKNNDDSFHSIIGTLN
jgi:translation elongation factor EF-G